MADSLTVVVNGELRIELRMRERQMLHGGVAVLFSHTQSSDDQYAPSSSQGHWQHTAQMNHGETSCGVVGRGRR